MTLVKLYVMMAGWCYYQALLLVQMVGAGRLQTVVVKVV